MDVKVYKKETVSQPSGDTYIYVPDVIDLMPVINKDAEGHEIITGVQELNDGDYNLLEQLGTLATIKQRGLDPLDLNDGIQWSEMLLGEVSYIDVMDEIVTAVAKETTSVIVEFNTTVAKDGVTYLTYTLKEAA